MKTEYLIKTEYILLFLIILTIVITIGSHNLTKEDLSIERGMYGNNYIHFINTSEIVIHTNPRIIIDCNYMHNHTLILDGERGEYKYNISDLCRGIE